ncbi:hypothetical protein ALC53_05037 [Atta colombica]|uniref:Biogenesis of lysosome-related organelles complex 1 subunit 7 n=1 Tax=Atta colombica TaxID=520822 RepID=A0A151I4U8_9HYME|nr:hypothetical protein ALC53_05037 [Atta colombica]
MSVNTVSNNTSIDNKIDDFYENLTEDVCVLPLLNKHIRTTRIRVQIELKHRLRKLVEAEHNIAMSNHILQNTKKDLNKVYQVYQDVLSMTKQKALLHTNSACNSTSIETNKEES